MSPTERNTMSATASFPRVSGDEPDVLLKRALPKEFSPRERG